MIKLIKKKTFTGISSRFEQTYSLFLSEVIQLSNVKSIIKIIFIILVH